MTIREPPSTVVGSEEASKDKLADRLLLWFERHARRLPWRQGRTPYRVWIAEVMLQQTRAETIAPYYEQFMARFPTVEALAAAPLEAVLKVWEGLGYYTRARHLRAAAQQIVTEHGGHLPSHPDALIRLPGIGRYIAGAIASIAFGQDVPAVDGNVRRVLSRVFAVQDDVTRAATQHRLETLAADLLPVGRAGPFNEALMELGAQVCLPRNPRCDVCPLRSDCQALALGEMEAFPVRPPRRKTPHYTVAAAVTVRDDGRVLVAQRHADGMLGGLWEFPGGQQEAGESLSECLIRALREEVGVEVEVGAHLTTIEHTYTHFRITLHAFCCRWAGGEPRCLDCAAWRWATPADIEQLPMSVVNRKIAQHLAPYPAEEPYDEHTF